MCLPQTEAIRSNDVFHKSVSRVGSHRSIQAPTVIFEARRSLNDVPGVTTVKPLGALFCCHRRPRQP